MSNVHLFLEAVLAVKMSVTLVQLVFFIIIYHLVVLFLGIFFLIETADLNAGKNPAILQVPHLGYYLLASAMAQISLALVIF